MEELGFEQTIDWENIFDDVQFPNHPFDFSDATLAPEVVDSGESWIGEIEKLLMNDDHHDEGNLAVVDGFMMEDILLDSPEGSPEGSPAEVVEGSSPVSENSGSEEGNVVNVEKNDGKVSSPDFDEKADDDDTDDADPLSKKRKRQLRNKDAAMRSRERKKMYVKDLEVKSRYLEAECRRLGRLLQCCYAENQMLRISLQSGSTFAMSKPESAVLSPESLLLGSLVWLMALMCLLPLPILTLPSQGAVALGSIDRKNLGSAAQQRGKGNKPTELWLSLSFMKTKKCRASRTKMKSNFACLVAVV